MTDYHLISHHLCPYVQRAVIVLTEKDIPHRRSYIDLANKPAWFKAMSPLGRVPVMQTGDTVIFESQVIAEYLDEVTPGSLHPTDPAEKARHRSWIEFGSETLSEIGGFYSAADAETFERRRAVLRDKFSRVNEETAGPYFAGPTFHMIDGVWGTIFRYFDTFDQIGTPGCNIQIGTGFPECIPQCQSQGRIVQIDFKPTLLAVPGARNHQMLTHEFQLFEFEVAD